jgi:parallel beta-helix repeat protein
MAITLGVLLAVAPAASASTIHVRDDRPNAIQRAINRADGGDRLRIHDGRYREDVAIDKRLKLVGSKNDRPVIDGECVTDETVDFAHRGITLKRLKVIGAGGPYAYNINILLQETGRVENVVVRETCNGGDAALYGINVFDGGAIEIRDVRVFGGFRDAGIYVGGITDTSPGPLIAADNEVYGNNVGILVEDSAGVQMRVRNNSVHGNDASGLSVPAGIYSRRSDGIRYVDNRIRNNGQYGIRLDSQSQDNVFFGNRFAHNPTPLLDQGSGNCGSGNVPDLFDPC